MKIDIYNRKCFRVYIKINVKKIIWAIITILLGMMVFCSTNASPLTIVILSAMSLGVSLIEIECTQNIARVLNIMWVMMTAIALLFLSQLLLNERMLSLGAIRIILGTMCIGIVLLLIYIISCDYRITVIVTTLFLMSLTLTNYFVVNFRGNELTPTDIFAVGTAINVASEYEYSVGAPVIYAMLLAIIWIVAGFSIPRIKINRNIRKMVIGIVVEVIMITILVVSTDKIIHPQHFFTDGTATNGFFLNFIARFETTEVKKPENYNKEIIESYEQEYGTSREEKDNSKPDIIVIMNESFADLSLLGELKTNQDVKPFYDSLSENVIKGYAYASVFGGGTCNSEYEVLTGNSMAFFPTGSYPYQQYLKQNTWSIASYLEQQGYETLATHPEKGVNWMRTTVYPYYGFDNIYFKEAYLQENLLRGHVSDQEMYEQLITWYEAKEDDENVFYFGVTMQNHSPYDYQSTEFEEDIKVEGYSKEYPDVNQYLTIINRSDQALEYLVNYFKTVEKDVVLLFFGDHFPRISNEFYSEIYKEGFETLEEQMLQYKVPFVIWTNFDIEENIVECTSLNYLSNYVYKAAEMELSPYNRFLDEMMEYVPAINAHGYYSKEKGKFISLDEAEGNEAKWIEKYQNLQYNSTFDDEGKSEIFWGRN